MKEKVTGLFYQIPSDTLNFLFVLYICRWPTNDRWLRGNQASAITGMLHWRGCRLQCPRATAGCASRIGCFLECQRRKGKIRNVHFDTVSLGAFPAFSQWSIGLGLFLVALQGTSSVTSVTQRTYHIPLSEPGHAMIFSLRQTSHFFSLD